ncbi:MAG: gamma-glutamyl-gamma-aminobutyrate hydrolase family protein, partial [Firmicutes bacterium]|nr:gamma-glutamyl-gamma-aminobutyrate hydrolase family protein [Bacillota bacterium]
RGIEGKIKTAEYARKNNIPYLGICLGMQIAVIEFARNVAGIKGATSSEFDPTAANPVIDIMEEQKQVSTKGATMRLGLYDCKIKSGTKVAKLYGKTDIKERHRHRFEFNNKYREQLEKAGLKIVGVNEDADLVEIIELPNHKYYVASQFHPEFLSKPNKPHPLFVGLMNAIRN